MRGSGCRSSLWAGSSRRAHVREAASSRYRRTGRRAPRRPRAVSSRRSVQAVDRWPLFVGAIALLSPDRFARSLGRQTSRARWRRPTRCAPPSDRSSPTCRPDARDCASWLRPPVVFYLAAGSRYRPSPTWHGCSKSRADSSNWALVDVALLSQEGDLKSADLSLLGALGNCARISDLR